MPTKVLSELFQVAKSYITPLVTSYYLLSQLQFGPGSSNFYGLHQHGCFNGEKKALIFHRTT